MRVSAPHEAERVNGVVGIFRKFAAIATLCCLSGCTPGAGTKAETTTPAEESTTTAAGDGCPEFDDGTETGTIQDSTLDEISGLAASRRNPGVLWVHEDSGADAVVTAVRPDGTTARSFRLEGVRARDWEDIAVGPGPDTSLSYLYVGDIGDNLVDQKQFRVVRLAEPAVGTGSSGRTDASGAQTLTGRFPDGPHNAEVLMSDPVDGSLYVVTKAKDGISGVYRWPAPQKPDAPATLERVGRLTFGVSPLAGDTRATAGDISPDGSAILLRTYTSAFLWKRPPGSTITQALAATPCPVPVRLERQGEAIGFSADGTSYFTTTEGPNPPLIRYDPASR